MRVFASTLIPLLLLILTPTAGHTSDTADRRPGRVIIEGTVFDADTRQPLAFATVRVLGTGRSTSTNEEGRFRLLLGGNENQLRFSHVAYNSELVSVTRSDSAIQIEISLHPVMLDVGTIRVSSRAYDPAQLIIVEAIKRKKDILARIHDYRYDAYTKLVVTDETEPDSSEIWLMTETQTTACWEQPDKYKEIITSRRQSANIPAEGNLVTVGEILNFNRDRIDLERYSVVSPTASDALNHYNYYLLDTLYIDSLAVFRLEIEPKNPDDPLFAGFVHIADSTYDVVEVDIGVSRGLEFPFHKRLRYSQKYARFENEYWMPIEIRLSGEVVFGAPLPGVPGKIGFAHVASLYSYQFEAGHPRGIFDEYIVEVDKKADEFDSLAWYARQTIPLTTRETAAYRLIDSTENAPKPVSKRLLQGVAVLTYLVMVGNEDIFRFNRVEGPYLGLEGASRNVLDNVELRLKTGYSFDAKRWEHQYGFTYRLQQKRKLDIGLDYLNRVVRRPTIISSAYSNPTLLALATQTDPFDYYRTKGLRLFASTKVINHTRLSITYRDFRDYSMPVATNFCFLKNNDVRPRENPPVDEGTLRSLGAKFRYDSRMLLKDKGRDRRVGATQYTKFAAGVEYASPDLISNDFDFRRYHMSLFRRQRTLGLGVTSLFVYVGSSDGDLPPQRYYCVDFGDDIMYSRGFSTLNERNFGGNRALSIEMHHDFRRRLFVKSGLPLVREIPLWLSIHGGVFWTDFKKHNRGPDDRLVNTAAEPYREIGFGLGNLAPFMSPFNFAVYFTWQLSDYDTSDFSIGFGIEL